MFHLLQKLKIAFLTKVVPELKLQINRSAPFRNNSKYCKKKKKTTHAVRFMANFYLLDLTTQSPLLTSSSIIRKKLGGDQSTTYK